MAKKKEQELAMFINNRTRTDYFNRLKLIAVSLFKFKNLDKICGYGAERFLNMALFDYGRACFYKDKELGYMILYANPSDKLNNYYLPERLYIWSLGYNKDIDFDDCVYIMNNKLCLPTKETIDLFSYRLYDTERTIDVNLNAQKTPILLEGDEKSILSLKNVYMNYSGNVPVMYANKKFDLNYRINAVKTDAPYLIDKLEIHKHEIWNEALTYLGIDNANTDKKERLITDEVESNNDLINYYLNCFYETRKEAVDMINEKYLKDSEIKIELELNNELLKMLREKDMINLEVGDNLEQIYNNNQESSQE